MILFPLGVLIACLLATRVYETTAKIVITAKQVSQSLTASPTGPGPAQVMNLNVDEMDLNTEMEILRSLDLWESTVTALGPELLKSSSPGILSSLKRSISDFFGEDTPQQIDQAERADKAQRVKNIAKSLIANFEAIPTPKSKVIDLSLRYPDPSMVQRILSTLLEKYIPYHLSVYSVPGVESFLADQLKEAKEAHEKANNDLTEFRKRWNLALPERQKAEIITMMKTLDDALIEANSNLKQIEEMLNIVRAGGAVSGQLSPGMQRGGESTVINVVAVQHLQSAQKQLQVSEYFTAESRDYRAAVNQTTEIGARFKSLLEGELAVLRAKKASLENTKESLLEEMRTLVEKSEDARTLQLQETMAREQYIQMITKSQAARMENQESREQLVDVKVLAAPFLPSAPVFPRTALFFLGSILFSFPLALAIIFMAHFFDYTFETPGSLEKGTGFRVLATLGKLRRKE
jgi:uncharacterized protein involved in exopolysaccharide biosynthesis